MNIISLSKAFKFDYTNFISNQLNADNFIEHQAIVTEILTTNKSKEFLQENCDKIIDICLVNVFETEDEQTVLKYIELAAPNCSQKTCDQLIQVYLFYFNRVIQSNNEIHLNNNIKQLSLEQNKYFKHHLTSFNQKHINFINSYLNYLKFDHLDAKDTKVEFLIDISLNVLEDSDENDQLISKLCINTLSKLAGSNQELKNCVLSSYFSLLRLSISNLTLNDKKRLESFRQDTNLSLLTSLADYLLPINNKNFEASYLKSTEYWRLIQSGLIHTNSLTRKRALYLLKRTTDYSNSHIQVQKSDYNVLYSSANQQVFLYDGSLSEWNEFFMCVEIMEETSVHIIKPALNKATQLADSVLKFRMHYSWLFVLFNRAFLHESKYVVRWSVLTFLQTKIHLLIQNSKIPGNEEALNSLIADLMQFIFGPLMLILQKSYLFYKTEEIPNEKDNCPKIGKSLSDFLNSFVSWLPTNALKLKFLEQFTQIVCNYTWNSISLLFICNSFKNLTLDTINLSNQCVKNMCQIVQCSLTTHEPFIRSAIQTVLLESLLKHTTISSLDTDLETFNTFLDAINVFSTKECLKYNNSSWFLITKWFSDLLVSNKDYLIKYLDTEFNQFIENSTNNDYLIQSKSAKLAKLILVLNDCLAINLKPIDVLIDKLTNCNRNLYMSSDRVEKCLLIFNFLLSFSSNNSTVNGLYKQCASSCLDYILRRAAEANLSFSTLNLYIDVLNNIIRENNYINDKIIKTYLPAIEANLAATDSFSSEWKRFIFLNIFASLIQSHFSKTNELKQFTLKNQQLLTNIKILNKSSLNGLKKDISQALIDDLMDQYSVFNGQYLEKLWQCKEYLLKLNPNSDLLSNYEDSLDLASPYCLASLVKCAANFNFNESKLVEIFDTIYKLVWDIKEDVKNFLDSYQSFLDCLVDIKVFITNPDYLIQTIMSLIDRSADKACVIRPLVNKTIDLLKQLTGKQIESFTGILIRLVLFGDVYKKEKKHMKDVEIYIEGLGESFGTNQLLRAEYLHDSGVRITTLNFLLTAPNLNPEFYSNFTKRIIHKDEAITESNQKLFINSLVHRERFRLWQVILLILSRLNSEDYFFLMTTADKYLISENQPSMRILIEWVVIRIISSQIDSFDLFGLFTKLENFSHKRVGYTCSWLAILTHLINIIQDNDKKCAYFSALIPMILSQILSNNFHVRTYVEAILIKLYRKISSTNNEFSKNERVQSVLKQIYSIVHTILDDAERHSSIILKHFYFQFDPIDDYSIDTIFNIFPNMSGIIDDELVSVDSFLSIVLDKPVFSLTRVENLNFLIKLYNVTNNLDSCTQGVWRFIAYRDDVKSGENLTIEDLQKKIIPWQNLMPNHEDLKETHSKSDLILVASLIDKQTNLGGICRTCEIFNVKELVVGSLKHLEDKLFQSLSVTAEKWLNIKEVAVKFLKKYLFEMKLQGYTLIGLEQTAKSVQLNEFKFPAKTLIVLGNEKEGIPVDLIQMLDVCVEIPQLGVIRSLNVHVSCAICVWEYTKQNLIKN